jgi:hypothetical protein
MVMPRLRKASRAGGWTDTRAELHRLEDGGVWLEGDLGAGAGGVSKDFQLALGNALGVVLMVNLTALVHLHVQPLGESVHHRHTHTVQADRDFVGLVVELAAGVQHGHHHLHGGDVLAFMKVNGNAAAVVVHAYGAVGLE